VTKGGKRGGEATFYPRLEVVDVIRPVTRRGGGETVDPFFGSGGGRKKGVARGGGNVYDSGGLRSLCRKEQDSSTDKGGKVPERTAGITSAPSSLSWLWGEGQSLLPREKGWRLFFGETAEKGFISSPGGPGRGALEKGELEAS